MIRKSLVPALCLLLSAALHAQVANNTALVGTVTDAGKSVIASATVAAINEAKKVTCPGTTNGEGYYSIQYIQPGTYDITVEHDGSSKVQSRGVVVQLNMAARTDVSLTVGSTSTEVKVTAATPALSTDDALIGETLGAHAVATLPLAGRHPMDLAATASNVIIGPKTSFTGNPPGANYIGEGTREVTNSLTLDGITIMNSLISNSPVTPPDAIGGVQTQTGNYTAQYGAYMGVHINMDTKSGTNAFHGTVYDYVQNDLFNAKSFFTETSAPIPELRFNEFGGQVGGPILRDRLFFMGSYDGTRQVNQTQATGTVLTAAERAGDFSALTSTSLKNPANGLTYANNQVTNISPIATALLQYMPLPKQPGLTNNLNANVANNINNNETLDRVDYNPTEKFRFFGRYYWQKLNYVAGSLIPTSTSYSPTTDSNGAFGYTQLITPTLVNDFHFGHNKLTTKLLNAFAQNNIQGAGAALGIPGFNSDVTNANPGIPSINTTNFLELGSDGTN